MASERQTQAPVFRWQFMEVRFLRRALEEYLDFLDNTVVTRYGDRVGGDGLEPEAQMNAARRRSEIDACMEVLLDTCPFFWRILDVHYRRGAGTKPRGWALTANAVGLRRAACPRGVRCDLPGEADGGEHHGGDLPGCGDRERLRCAEDRQVLQQQLGMATGRLYAIHRARHDAGT